MCVLCKYCMFCDVTFIIVCFMNHIFIIEKLSNKALVCYISFNL